MTYIFDFFGVISSEVAPFWFARYLPEHDILELREKYLNDADLGKVSLRTFWEGLAKLTNQDKDAVSEQWFTLVQIDKHVVSSIEKLHTTQKIALCSNAPSDFIRPILKMNNLERLFDQIVISSEVGMLKPNRDIFLYTLEKLGTTADKTFFIDDSEKNIMAAKELGMKTILYKNGLDIENLTCL